MEISHELAEKVLGIYFRQCYSGFGENSQEDIDFINQNDFKVIITEETSKHGYDFDKERIKVNGLKINTPYTLDSMDVGRSYSNLTLKEFPNLNFNSVNFNFLKQ